MANSCSRSLLSRTERSRASVDSTLMGTFLRWVSGIEGNPSRRAPHRR
jgi:hypothetical protein